MRAGAFLEALAADHDVTLLLVPVAGAGEPGHFVLDRVRRFAVLSLEGALDPLYRLSAQSAAGASAGRDPFAALRAYPRPHLCRWATTPALRQAEERAGAEPFAAVVVLRSYLAPYAAPFLASPLRFLDLDDDERLTHRRLAALRAGRGEGEAARRSEAEAAKYEEHERRWLPRFDGLFASSEVHEEAVRARLAAEGAEVAVRVVPNSVEIPEGVERGGRGEREERGEVLRLLFVGNLGYEPNVDAALWLARELLPRLREGGKAGVVVGGEGEPGRVGRAEPAGPTRAKRRVELTIAGSHPAEAVSALTGVEGVTVHANPPDLAPFYARSDVALAPIRAGGGTRIKILEALAHQVPVVATAIGAEGIAARDGVHLLLAEGVEEFAEAVRRIGDEPGLARELASEGRELVRERYSRAAAVEAIRRAVLTAATSRTPSGAALRPTS
jgi:glycosyltransferase involved in cell wall biosynthesis